MVNAEDSRSKPWSLDMGSNPCVNLKLDGKNGPLDGRKNNKNNKDSQTCQVTTKNIFLTIVIIFFRERAAVSVAIAKMGTAIRIAIKDHYQVYHYV